MTQRERAGHHQSVQRYKPSTGEHIWLNPSYCFRSFFTVQSKKTTQALMLNQTHVKTLNQQKNDSALFVWE